MMKNEGINKLGRVIAMRINQSGEKPLTLEIGTIQPDRTLLLNTFKIPIPRGEYLVCRSLNIGAVGEVLTKTRGQYPADVLVPESMRKLMPGDAVLVAWVGNDAVIIDILVSGGGE